MVALLLDRRASLDICGAQDLGPVEVAAAAGHAAVLRLLGTHASAGGALALACRDGHLPAVRRWVGGVGSESSVLLCLTGGQSPRRMLQSSGWWWSRGERHEAKWPLVTPFLSTASVELLRLVA